MLEITVYIVHQIRFRLNKPIHCQVAVGDANVYVDAILL